MDKTTVFDTTLCPNNRKPAADSKRYTESFLCDEIHANLRAMSYLVPFHSDLEVVFAHGMFIKPNAKAFPHVTRYLLVIYDATEFKKKFRWPIFDKAGEALFRNSTMEAMNKINVKYGLGLGDIKNKILVFPGGMEFMRLIYEVSRLCMQILIKRHGTTHTEPQELTLSYVRDKTANMGKLYETTQKYSREMRSRNDLIQTKSRTLLEILDIMIANTNITRENILCDEFLDSWTDVQLNIIENAIEPSIMEVHTFQTKCDQLVNHIQTAFNSEKAMFNATDLNAFAVNMQSLEPQYYQHMAQIQSNGQLRMDRLLQAFRLAVPFMMRSVETQKTRSIDVLQYESDYMHNLSLLANNIFQKALQLNIEAEIGHDRYEPIVDPMVRNSMLIDFKSLVLSTPPISYDASKRPAKSAIQTKRISLMDTEPAHMRSIPMLQSLADRSMALNKDADQTLVNRSMFRMPTMPNAPSETVNKRLDPMRLLRAVNRKPHIGSPKRAKPVLQQFGHSASMISTNDTALSVPDFSSTLIGNEAKDTSHHNLSDHINMSMAKALSTPTRATDADCMSPIGGASRKRRTQLDNMRRSIAADISLSPSGRVEPLSTTVINRKNVTMDNSFDTTLKGLDSFGDLNIGQAYDGSKTLVDQMDLTINNNRSSEPIDGSNIENDINITNRPRIQNLASLIDENDECLMNVSDGILAEIDCSF